MDEIIKVAEKISYSDSDIKRLLDDKVRIIKYSDLSDFKNMDEVFGGCEYVCILYMTKQNFGHWTCILKNPGGIRDTYEVFDPYGIFPDDELNYIDDNFREESNQNRQHLSYLIKDELESKKVKEVFYNKYQLQENMNDINTCGRWCGMRCFLNKINIKEFIMLFINQKLKPDMIVTYMTIVNR